MCGIRERGVAIASVIVKDLVGIAAPVFAAPDPIAAALTLVRIRKEVDEAAIERLTSSPSGPPAKCASDLARAADDAGARVSISERVVAGHLPIIAWPS